MSNFNSAKAVDIFCGCGGMSWGLQKEGIQILLGIDSDPKYVQSFRANFGNQQTLEQDIRKLSGKKVLNDLGLQRGELDLLVGGPPCQGFSKNTPVGQRKGESDNNLLIREYLRFADDLLPKNLIIENVAEMRNGFGGQYTVEILDALDSRGYEVLDHVFDASDYGLPQRRKRAFFIASREGRKLRVPTITHAKNDSGTFDIFGLKPKTTVWDAISDLPNLKHGEGGSETGYKTSPNTSYQINLRGRRMRVKNHIARRLSDIQYRRLCSLKPGQGLKDLPKELQVRGGYSGVYGRLTKEMLAPTITRWVFHPGSGRWGHPEDIRTITPRETARIQGFSDDFTFSGSYTDICGQLGNAVPPILMQTILKSFSS